MKGARIWHNIAPGLDAVEYIPGAMYGIMHYPEADDGDIEYGTWVATMLTAKEVLAYIDWCDFVCDKYIYNAYTKGDNDDDWL